MGVTGNVTDHTVRMCKTIMGLDVLKCKTVGGGLKELIVFALIDNVIRLVIGQAARQQQVSIDRISCIDAALWLTTAQDDERLSPLVVNPPHPWRYEPRVRKRRPQPYPLMRKTRQELRKSLANKADVD